MLKYQAEKNWANNVHELHGKYNRSLNDGNVCNLTYALCKNGTWSSKVCGILSTNWDVLGRQKDLPFIIW